MDLILLYDVKKLNGQKLFYLLIIDDFGLHKLEDMQRLDMMEIIEDRHGRKSTLIASQWPVAVWYEIIAEPTLSDAIMDR